MNYAAAAPEIFIGLAICVVLLVDVFLKDHQRETTYVLAMGALIGVAAVTLYFGVSDRVVTFSGSYVTDPASSVLKMFAYVTLGITFLYSREYLQNNGLLRGEFFLLGLFGLLGVMIMISAHSLLTLYLGLEVLALSQYTLVAFNRESSVSAESAMKYFVLGAIASGALLYGISLLYGITGITLIFFLDGARVGFEISPNGACSNSGTGRITILPPGAPGRWHCAGSMEYLAVCLPALHAIREENSPTTFLCLSDDPVLIRIGQVLAEILTRRGEMDPPEASAWSSLLGSHLVQRYGFARRWLTSKGQSRLSSAQIRSMVDFIDENLHEPLAVSQLAAMTGMSRAKFTESFKCSTGMSPYKFVIERRTLMAKKLLGHSNLSLSSIAHTVGFSSQSHMTSTFRRLAGITPQAYRAWQKPRRSEDVVKPRVGPSIGRGL